MRRRIVQLVKADAVGLRWHCPVLGRIVGIQAGARVRGPHEFWVDGDRIELHVPAEQAFAVVEVG